MIVFSALLAAYVFSQFYRAFLAVIAPDLTRELGLGPAELGALSAVFFAVFALAQLPIGVALDRVGPRRTVSALMVFMAVGGALFAAGRDFTTLAFAMALVGLGCAPVFMGGLYVIGRSWPPTRFAALSSLMIGLGSFGNLFSTAPLAWGAATVGWRASLGVAAALAALCTGAVALTLRDPPRVERPAEGGSLLADLGALLAIRALWPMLPLVFVSYAVVIAERSLWIGPFFTGVHGFSKPALGDAALAMAVALTAGGLAYGPASRLLGLKRAVAGGAAVAGAGFLALGVWPAMPSAAAVTTVCAIGFFGITYAILMSHARLFFPDHLLGRGMTLMNLLFIGGVSVVQTLSGRFVEMRLAGGASPAETYGGLHFAFGAALLGAGALYLLAPAAAEASAHWPAPSAPAKARA